MNTPSNKHLPLYLPLILVWAVAIACVFPQSLINRTTQVISSPTAATDNHSNPTIAITDQSSSTALAATEPSGGKSPTPTAANQDDLSQTDPLDHLLDMRSIQFTLTVTRPDGTIRSLDGQIDNKGNMQLNFRYTGFDLSEMPKDYNPLALPTGAEIFVIEGKAYLFDELDPSWYKTSFDEDYLTSLAQQLHGLESPAMWLNVLPEGSIQLVGKETVGGFTADKFSVSGKVDGQMIAGTIWEEPQTDALVQAELHIPAALLSPPDQPLEGEMKITLEAHKADIAIISLPAS
jgi:hypothetical protein